MSSVGTSGLAGPIFPLPYAPPDRLSWRGIAAALRTNALEAFSRRAFEEDVVTRNFFGREQIILSRPAAIRHVLVENPENYRRTAAVVRVLRPIIGDGLFLAEGEEWRQQRRTVAPAFAPRTIPLLAPHIASAADGLVAELERLPREEVDLLSRLQRVALDIAGSSMFSLEMEQFGASMRAEILHYAERLGRPALLDFLVPRGLPSPRDFGRFRFRRRWLRLIERLVIARQEQASPQAPRDLLDLLAAGLAAEAEGGAVPARRLADQVATMIVAGHETTAVALFWSLYLIAASPAVQERVASEALPADLRPSVAADALPALPITRAVVQEALRLYPPGFSIVRQARAADRTEGVTIPANAVVLIVPWILHRHRQLWDEPDRFDPGRFLPDATPPDRFAYLPFGAGPRSCVGAQFALTEAVLVLARLVQAFRIELAAGPPPLPVAVITLQPDHAPGFRLRPRRG